jgi:uncharacterized protein (DUF58 family)
MSISNSRAVRQFSDMELFAREVVEGFITGLHKSPFHGFSVEFAEHRLYNNGESTRHIDWKLFARTEKLFVKRYEEETNLRCQIVIDRSSSMYYPQNAEETKVSFSIKAAAALSHLLRTQRDAVGLSTFNNTVELHLPARLNRQHMHLLYDELTALEKEAKPQQTTDAINALHEISERIHQRSLVVIFSDLFDSHAGLDELFAALQHLRYNKHEVVIFHTVKQNEEMDFAFENRPHRFVDLETGAEVKLNPSEVRKAYKEKLRALEHELKIRCGQYRIDYVEADIDQGFAPVLTAYLQKRMRMLK